MSGSRRRRLLIGSVPVAVLLLAFAGKAFVMLGANHAGQRAYEQGVYASAARDFDRNRAVDVLEGWVAAYNRGTSLYRDARLDEARAELEYALGHSPRDRDCMVRINLSATIEAQGDASATARRAKEAAQRYREALGVLREGSCGSDAGDAERDAEEQASAREAERRLEDKLRESESTSEDPSPSPSPSSSPSPSPSPSPGETESKAKQLEERNEKGRQQAVDDRDYDEQSSEDPPERRW